GRLYRERNVITHVHGRKLVNRSGIDVLRAHHWAREINDIELDPAHSLLALRIADELGLQGVSIDLGLLLADAPADNSELERYVREHLRGTRSWENQEPTDVVLYGFGRIGRLVARLLIGHAGSGLGLRL